MISKYLFAYNKHTCSNKNKSRNESTSAEVSTVQNPDTMITVITINKPHVLSNLCVNTVS